MAGRPPHGAGGSLAAQLAPGKDIPTTEPGGRWFLVSGNSYAAAHVSGLFALLRERSPRTLSGTVLVSARSGGGVIDACATLWAGTPREGRCAKPYEYLAHARP